MTMLGLAILAAAVGADPLVDETYQDFRGAKFTEQLFQRVGTNPDEFMKAEADGLHIKLPVKAEAIAPVGVSTRLVVHGDFEITATYQILHLGKPEAGYGSGVSLWAVAESKANDTATLARFVHPGQGEVYATDREMDGKHKERYFPTTAQSGRLRLVRTGSTLSYLVAEGDSPDFKEVRREEFTLSPLKGVRLAADTGTARSEVDVRLVDFRVRADEISPSLVSSLKASSSPVWYLWAGGFGAGLLIIVGGAVFWLKAGKKPVAKER